jgi:competence protein ComEC
MTKSQRLTLSVLIIASLIVGVIGFAAFREDRHGVLTVSFLDIGQGDAIFIDAPSGRQVLVDGGPPSGAVLRRLGSAMPWWDRSIDVVLSTHPDADHVGGLIDVLARFTVGTIIRSSVEGDTKTFAAFNKAEADEGAHLVTAMRGQVVDLGAGTYLEILAPDRAVPGVDTNDGSIVARLVYGATSFMLTGDAPQSIENYVVALGTSTLKSDVLKAGHHGSKTSSSALFLGFVDPAYGVYSRGCDNKYGHPNQETIDMFARFGIPTLDTCTEGTITFVSDGQTVVRK